MHSKELDDELYRLELGVAKASAKRELRESLKLGRWGRISRANFRWILLKYFFPLLQRVFHTRFTGSKYSVTAPRESPLFCAAERKWLFVLLFFLGICAVVMTSVMPRLYGLNDFGAETFGGKDSLAITLKKPAPLSNSIKINDNTVQELVVESFSNQVEDNSNKPINICAGCLPEGWVQRIRNEEGIDYLALSEHGILTAVSDLMLAQDDEFSWERETYLIQILQEELKNLGFQNIVADGSWNVSTSEALVSLAEKNTCDLRSEVVDESNIYTRSDGREYRSINRNDLIENFDVNRNKVLFDKVHNCIVIELMYQNN